MKSITYIFHGDFVDLNNYIKAERTNRFMGAKIKREETERVYWEATSQSMNINKFNVRLVPKAYPFNIDFIWYVPNLKKDPDNIAATGRKFILDGLVKAGVLKGDGMKYIKGFSDRFEVDRENIRVEVIISEIIS